MLHTWPFFLLAQILCVPFLWMIADYIHTFNIYRYRKFRKAVAIYTLATPISMWISPLVLAIMLVCAITIAIRNCIDVIREEW